MYWDEMVEALSKQKYDPNATRGYELCTGSFTWSDEIPQQDKVAKRVYLPIRWFMQQIYAYRTSLIRGQPDERFSRYWEDIQRDCPDWPALRPERCSPILCAELDAETRNQVAELEHLIDTCERAERIAHVRRQLNNS
jgi:hypothetical protein